MACNRSGLTYRLSGIRCWQLESARRWDAGMQKAIYLDDGRIVTLNICDGCGHVWIQESQREPKRCPSRPCHTATWNTGGINKRTSLRRAGRPAKNEQTVRAGLRPILDIEGKHHTLCPCLECLVVLGQQIKARHEQMYKEWLAKVQAKQPAKAKRKQGERLDRGTLRGSGPNLSAFPVIPVREWEDDTLSGNGGRRSWS